jgi:hypothetical protein
MLRSVCPPPKWNAYCGCATIDCLTIDMNVCEGTDGLLTLVLRDAQGKDIRRISLDGPIDGNYNNSFDLGAPIRAESITDAVLVNESDDSVTLTFLSVIGHGQNGFDYKFAKHKSEGLVIDSQSPRLALL